MHKSIRVACLIAALAAVASCEAQYGPRGFMTQGGYADEALMNDRFQISFEGTPMTSLATTEQLFYRRAEQIVRERGYASYRVESLRSGMQAYPTGGARPMVFGVIQAVRGPGGAGAAPSPGRSGSGTGFVISRDGLVLTNNHVAGECRSLAARFGAQGEIPASLVAGDATNDLALVRLSRWSGESASFRDSRDIRQGDAVVAFGFPLSSTLSSEGNLTTGTVSAVAGMQNDTRFLQISAPIQPGNSGGPLFDRTGAVIGVNAATISTVGGARLTGGAVPQNVNFAIKSAVVRLFLESNRVAMPVAAAGRTLEAPEIGERAKRVTVQVICRN